MQPPDQQVIKRRQAEHGYEEPGRQLEDRRIVEQAGEDDDQEDVWITV